MVVQCKVISLEIIDIQTAKAESADSIYIFVHIYTYVCMYITYLVKEKEAINLRMRSIGVKEG